MKWPQLERDRIRSLLTTKPTVLGIALLSAAATLGMWLGSPNPEVVARPVSSSPLDASFPHNGAPPFWQKANVPEPAAPRLPTPAIAPLAHGATTRDYAAEMRIIEDHGTAQALTDTLLPWYSSDPHAAAAWLNATCRFEELTQAVSSLALSIGASGHLKTALAWAEAISDETVRHETRKRIYAQEVRQRRISGSALQEAGFVQPEIDEILNGSLAD
ncbi:MAG TPA: hypothetical protein VD994_11170 [Prosthecobacter sp.]|nr:hypothetical protein [Prosthecobacter sp.]